MLKTIRNIIIIFVIFVVIIIAPFFIVTIINDTYTAILTNEMRKSKAPPQTEIVEIVSYLGNSTGTSNHAEAWICMLLKSKLSEEDLTEYYEQVYKQIRVYKVTKDRLQWVYMGRHNKIFESLKNTVDYNEYFTVERIEGRYGLLWFFDPRGH